MAKAAEAVFGRAVVLVSGGVDSSTLLRSVCRKHGRKNVFAISFHYGQRHARELRCAAFQVRAAGAAEHRIVNLRPFAALASASALTSRAMDVPELARIAAGERDQPPTYVPNRNLTLLALAAAWAESLRAGTVYYGAQRQDRYGYWDCTPEFLRRLNCVLDLNRRCAVRIAAPFARWSKSRVIRFGLELGVDFAHTWTCYRGGRRPCGVCPSCVERADAFRRAGGLDPLAPRRADTEHRVGGRGRTTRS